MSTLSSILGTIQGGKTNESASSLPKNVAKTPQSANGLPRKASTPTVPSLKRKSEPEAQESSRKAPKVVQNGVERPKIAPSKPLNTQNGSGMPARPAASTSSRFQLSQRPTQNATKAAAPAPLTKPKNVAPPASAPILGAAPKKRGFAALMAKAAAAQDASKASGPEMIKHKASEKLTKRERLRLAQEAEQAAKDQKRAQARAGTKAGSRPADSRNEDKAGKKAPKVEYSGTMRANSAAKKEKPVPKGAPQDKYGGYASWSDLDEAEDEDEGSYDSGSDNMEGGYDEMMEEELRATRIARREDDEALIEEEKHKREKLERKKRLMALSASAASAKKRY